MNIAIGGEGDAPAKRCGVTMKLTDDMVTAYATKTGYDFSTYMTGATFVDSDFSSQTVVGTPLEDEENERYIVPIAVGINKACRDYIVSLGEDFDLCGLVVNGEDIEDLLIIAPMLYEDDTDYVIVGTMIVDDVNSTQLSNDNWESLTLVNDDEEELDTFNFDENTTATPDTLIFTPGE